MRASLWSLWEGRDETEQVNIGLTHLSNFSGLQNIGTVSDCLVAGP